MLFRGTGKHLFTNHPRYLFTLVIIEGPYTPTRVPQDVPNATVCFPGCNVGVLGGLIGRTCMVWMNGKVIWSHDREALLTRFKEVLERLVRRAIFAAAHKAVFFS